MNVAFGLKEGIDFNVKVFQCQNSPLQNHSYSFSSNFLFVKLSFKYLHGACQNSSSQFLFMCDMFSFFFTKPVYFILLIMYFFINISMNYCLQGRSMDINLGFQIVKEIIYS